MSATKPKPPQEAKPAEARPESKESAEALANRMVTRIAQLDEDRERARQFDQEECWRKYCKILLAETPPTEDDLSRLVDLCGELGVIGEQVRRDTEIVAKARRYEALIARREEFAALVVVTRDAMKAVRKENETRLDDAFRAHRHAEQNCSEAEFATDNIKELAKQAPHLFDRSVTPVRLLGG